MNMIKYLTFISVFLLSGSLSAHIGKSDDNILTTERSFGSGAVFVHIEKVGGSTLLRVLKDEFGVHTKGHAHNLRIETIGHDLKKSVFAVGHVPLRDVVNNNDQGKAVLVFMRKALARCISHIRYYKAVGQTKYGKNNGLLFMADLDLNNLNNIREIVARVPHVVNEFYYLAPPGLDVSFENMTDEKVDQCVNYALQHVAFFGDIDDLSGSLYRLNAALNLKIDVKKASQEHVNKTPDKIEKITNPEVIAFLKDRVKWSEMLYNKLRAAESKKWRIAIPKNPKIKHSPIIQYVMPEGFNPDAYVLRHADLKRLAKKKFLKPIAKSEKRYQRRKSLKKKLALQTRIDQKRYEMRKWAMLHYVTQGQKQKRAFK